MYQSISVESLQGDSTVNITDQVRDAVQAHGVTSGVCFVIVPHTTAGVVVNSALDPNTPKDIIDDIRRLIPIRTDFHHIFDTPSDAAGHVKASLVGNSVTLLIEDTDLVIGHSQSIMLVDFDGPRQRTAYVKVIEG